MYQVLTMMSFNSYTALVKLWVSSPFTDEELGLGAVQRLGKTSCMSPLGDPGLTKISDRSFRGWLTLVGAGVGYLLWAAAASLFGLHWSEKANTVAHAYDLCFPDLSITFALFTSSFCFHHSLPMNVMGPPFVGSLAAPPRILCV